VSDADDEQKRALIRELNEATKDARVALRELRDERTRLSAVVDRAREMIGSDFRELAARVVAEYLAGLNSALAKHAGEINEQVNNADEAIKRLAADMAGIVDADAFIAHVVDLLRGDLTKALDEQFATLAEEFFRAQPQQRRRKQRQQQPLPPALITPTFGPDRLVLLEARTS
jgi:hypothetical protein